MTELTADESEERRRSIGARRNPDTQEAILEAAEAIVAEEGIAGFSIEAVAKRARAGKPTIYKWWPGKTALLLDVYHRHKPANVHQDTGTVEGDVVAFFTAIFAHWGNTGAGQVFRFVVAEAQRDEAAAASLQSYATERRKQSGQIFERGVARGELAADIDTGLAADMLAGFVWHRLLTGRLIGDPIEMRQAARQLVRGLLAPGR
ncbi:TetR family transcriptional regulator [Devosia yakushimensis]|uniref:TetR family transcriptional regulator n=1 Tax=Devosia yakushimensis TaxID=470028 RepID=A0ABQ5UKK4_9HYPH|nr:TetR/AcrR family transcriptional regulator C-terminal ligand-binding domain-containing protein [Devosia yakushimensis]GLQ11718.1 TetR family transcriptional regulator [Devosia yakushimensis]